MIDTAKRITYQTGALREPQEGKGRFDFISPFALMRLARWYELGAKKYAPRNWEKGIPFSHCVDSAFRHLTKFLMGMDDEDHLAAVAWNVFALMHYQELGRTDLDDLPHYCTRRSRHNHPRVYLAGAIHGRPFSEVWKERNEVASLLREYSMEPVDPLKYHLEWCGVAPEQVWNTTVDDAFQERCGLADQDIVRQDKELLEGCDAVLIMTGDTVSSGTWLEFGYARYQLRIPVVVVAKNPTTWTRTEATAVFQDREAAVQYLGQYFRGEVHGTPC